MANIHKPQLTPKMYRHFAVITVAGTLLLAVFSDGENREAMANEIASQQRAVEARKRANAPKYGDAKLIQAQNSGSGSFGSEGSAYGSPMDSGGGVTELGLSRRGFNRNAGSFVPASYISYAVSEEELEGLTEEERAALLAKLRKNGLSADPKERQRQIDKLLQSSQQRAGSELTEAE